MRCTLCNGEGSYIDSTGDGTVYYQTCIACSGTGENDDDRPLSKYVHEPFVCPYDWDECDGIGEWVPDPYSLEISDVYLYGYRCMGERIYSSYEI